MQNRSIAYIVLGWYGTRDTIDETTPEEKRNERVRATLRTFEFQLIEQQINATNQIFK